jgi:hypothetical protein
VHDNDEVMVIMMVIAMMIMVKMIMIVKND